MGNRIVELKEQVYAYVNHHGPLLPAKVASEFRVTNMFVSALLSELVTTKKISLTKAKIGGSPLYYCKHQEAQLLGMLKSHLGQVQREALELLQEKKVLRDRDCLPHERVALRELHDFAKPVKFVVHDMEEWFWIWYVLPEEEAKKMIGAMLEVIYPQVQESVPLQVQEVVVVEEAGSEEQPVVEEKQISLIATEQPVEQKPTLKKKKKKVKLDKKQTLSFEEAVFAYFKNKEIKVMESRIIAKNKEINLVIHVSSTLGDLSYYVKARNKKRVTEGDLLLAYTEGQNMKLPTVFLSAGTVTKKGQVYMEKNLRGMNVMTLEG
ncbi:MAG TPA: hypothetical protein VJJ79_02660 [Candidatus Nanoarchaeia archaeon]|nr:hypothetical protein [Candidatus Nanoarchaeia archaeon]